jgi:hypothetical protein
VSELHQKRPRCASEPLAGTGLSGIHGEVAMAAKLKAPWPAFGGKSKIASLVWQRIGDVDNAIEPFCHSAAWLLARPHPPRVETLNDLDCMVANFWRATQQAPEAVAMYADGPVNEADLHARHRWLVLSDEAKEFRERMRTDPFYFDPLIAGWWVWGACCWIGGGWCTSNNDIECGSGKAFSRGDAQRPHITMSAGDGVPAKGSDKRGPAGGSGNRRARLGTGHGTAGSAAPGAGVHVPLPDSNRPQLADAFARGRGVHGNDAADHYLSQQRPQIGCGGPNGINKGTHDVHVVSGTCASRRAWLVDWFSRLRDRLRTVRVCSGHWLRVCDSESVTTRLGTTGIFLDPPYPSHGADGSQSRDGSLYATDGSKDELDALRDEVLAYCLERGKDQRMRIAVCGYQGDGYEALVKENWEEVAWKAQGGYGNRSKKGKANAMRERIWFSPTCISAAQKSLFDGLTPEPEEKDVATGEEFGLLFAGVPLIDVP